jgi:hypothetical protein
MLVVKSTSTGPESTLKNKHDVINYHCVQEVQVAEYILVTWIDGKKNLAIALTKITAGEHQKWLFFPHFMVIWRWSSLNIRFGSVQTAGTIKSWWDWDGRVLS